MNKDIQHSFYIGASPDDVRIALVSQEHIRNWWTQDAQINASKGIFRWQKHGWAVELDIENNLAENRVIWHCIRSNMQGTPAWIGTKIIFSLLHKNGGTQIEFLHAGYNESPCHEVCTQGWALVIGTSLKSYLETGTGSPYMD